MTKEVFDAIYKTVDAKSTEELLDVVNNHLNECSDDYKWMVALVLSRRNVEFSLDDFPLHSYDNLHYFEHRNQWKPIYLIVAVASFLIAFIVGTETSGSVPLMLSALVFGIAMICRFFKTAIDGEDVCVNVVCTGKRSWNYTESVEPSNNYTMNNKNTQDLIVDALNQLNCAYNIEEDSTEDDSVYYDIFFEFQAQNFIIRCFKDYLAVDLYYVRWYSVDKDKTAEVEKVKWALNRTNALANVTCIYDIDEENNSLIASSSYHFYLFPNTPDLKNLFNTILNDFFRQRATFHNLLSQAPADIHSPKSLDLDNIKIQGEC